MDCEAGSLSRAQQYGGKLWGHQMLFIVLSGEVGTEGGKEEVRGGRTGGLVLAPSTELWICLRR